MPLFLIVATCLLGAGLLVYALTSAFTGDEGFHLLTAQLIDKGKRPYVDFMFPQTPLNAYWNAFWLRLFGQTWRVPHVVAAVLVTAAAFLAAHFIWRHFPASRKWRGAAALTTLILIMSNVMVVEYGPIAQAYAACLFLTVAAFRLSIAAVERPRPFAAFAAGLCAGAAAGCSLLTATAAPVYFLWIFFCNRAGSRWWKAFACAIGGVIPCAPIVYLWNLSPRAAAFNLLDYHLFFRKLYWPNTLEHDLETVSSWVDSGQALVLFALAIIGLLYVVFRSQWPSETRRAFYLSAWLAAAMCAEISTAHPTFQRYFILVVPFAAILAALGLYTISERMFRPESPYPAIALLTLLLGLSLTRGLHQRAQDVRTWAVHEQLAKKVNQVVPRDAPIFADEEIYFLTGRTPPPGLEFSYSHKLKLAPALEAQLHIVEQDQINRMAAEGKIAAAATCDDEALDAMHLDKAFTQKFTTDDCYVYWGRATH